jgi:hypothetical protein
VGEARNRWGADDVEDAAARHQRGETYAARWGSLHALGSSRRARYCCPGQCPGQFRRPGERDIDQGRSGTETRHVGVQGRAARSQSRFEPTSRQSRPRGSPRIEEEGCVFFFRGGGVCRQSLCAVADRDFGNQSLWMSLRTTVADVDGHRRRLRRRLWTQTTSRRQSPSHGSGGRATIRSTLSVPLARHAPTAPCDDRPFRKGVRHIMSRRPL